MSISKTKIFNMALNELGVTAPISNASEGQEVDEDKTTYLNFR